MSVSSKYNSAEYFEYTKKNKIDDKLSHFGYFLDEYPKELKDKRLLIFAFRNKIDQCFYDSSMVNFSKRENVQVDDSLSSPRLVYIKK